MPAFDLSDELDQLERSIYTYANAVVAFNDSRYDEIRRLRRQGAVSDDARDQTRVDSSGKHLFVNGDEIKPAILWRELLQLCNAVLAAKDEPKRFRAVEPGQHL